jgi:hypothetical protein
LHAEKPLGRDCCASNESIEGNIVDIVEQPRRLTTHRWKISDPSARGSKTGAFEAFRHGIGNAVFGKMLMCQRHQTPQTGSNQ